MIDFRESEHPAQSELQQAFNLKFDEEGKNKPWVVEILIYLNTL